MKKSALILGIFVSVAYLIASRAYALEWRNEKSNIYIKNATFTELQQEFQDLEYTKFLLPKDNEYPRIFVENLPIDMDSPENKTIRNQIFMQILMPLALKLNQDIQSQRTRLFEIRQNFNKNQDFTDDECAYIEQLAKTYDSVTPFRDTRRCIFKLKDLIERIDLIPPSVMVAAAAIYTKWGTSRIAIFGNNLYKARNWYSDEGLKPIGEEATEKYRYTVYPSIEESMRAYMIKLNTAPEFQTFRHARKTSRRRSDTLFGRQLAWTFLLDNNLTNYAGLLDYTINFYKMIYFDTAHLEDEYDIEN